MQFELGILLYLFMLTFNLLVRQINILIFVVVPVRGHLKNKKQNKTKKHVDSNGITSNLIIRFSQHLKTKK